MCCCVLANPSLRPGIFSSFHHPTWHRYLAQVRRPSDLCSKSSLQPSCRETFLYDLWEDLEAIEAEIPPRSRRIDSFFWSHQIDSVDFIVLTCSTGLIYVSVTISKLLFWQKHSGVMECMRYPVGVFRQDFSVVLHELIV